MIKIINEKSNSMTISERLFILLGILGMLNMLQNKMKVIFSEMCLNETQQSYSNLKEVQE